MYSISRIIVACRSKPVNGIFRLLSQATGTPGTLPHEVSKFNAAAESWWNPGNDTTGPLLAFNAVRVPFIESAARTAGMPGLHGNTALDVGCGGGILSEVCGLRSSAQGLAAVA